MTLNVDSIEIIHLRIVRFINNIPNDSYIKMIFIINLTSILMDIIDLCNLSDMEWQEKDWHLDRVVDGFEGNFYKVNAKILIKKFIFKKNILLPILDKEGQKVQKLIFDADNLNLEDIFFKEFKNQYYTSVYSFFYGKFPEKGRNKELISVIDQFVTYLSTIDLLGKVFNSYNLRLMEFKIKMNISLEAAYFRFVQCKKYLPKNVNEIYLPTLFSPFNRTIALAGIEQGSRIISFDHGTGVAFTSCKTNINIELDLVSEYITFSDLFKEIISKNICQELRINNKVIPLLRSPNYLVKKRNEEKYFSNFRNILYIPSVISNKAHIPPLLNPSEYVQLQLNIIRNLKLIGNYQLFLKEHPETEVYIPQVILNELKIPVLKEKVEKLNKEFIFLIDYLQTTCLRFAISNNIPVVAIVVNKNLINQNIFSELCALPNFEYLIPKKHAGNYFIEKDQVLSLIENLGKKYSPNHENTIFGNFV